MTGISEPTRQSAHVARIRVVAAGVVVWMATPFLWSRLSAGALQLQHHIYVAASKCSQ
jgi:hypothetical protein